MVVSYNHAPCARACILAAAALEAELHDGGWPAGRTSTLVDPHLTAPRPLDRYNEPTAPAYTPAAPRVEQSSASQAAGGRWPQQRQQA